MAISATIHAKLIGASSNGPNTL